MRAALAPLSSVLAQPAHCHLTHTTLYRYAAIETPGDYVNEYVERGVAAAAATGGGGGRCCCCYYYGVILLQPLLLRPRYYYYDH